MDNLKGFLNMLAEDIIGRTLVRQIDILRHRAFSLDAEQGGLEGFERIVERVIGAVGS